MAFVLGADPCEASGPAWIPASGLVTGAQFAQLAPDGAPGIVTAVALGAVAEQHGIAVTPFADDDLSLAVKARFESALREAGRSVSDAANLTLSFETKVIEGRISRSEGSLGRFEADADDVRLNLNIWSTTQDSLIGGRQKARESRQAHLVHMNAFLRDEASGKTLWQADAYCEMLTSDTRRIALSMVTPLVASLGHSVQQKPFEIE